MLFRLHNFWSTIYIHGEFIFCARIRRARINYNNVSNSRLTYSFSFLHRQSSFNHKTVMVYALSYNDVHCHRNIFNFNRHFRTRLQYSVLNSLKLISNNNKQLPISSSIVLSFINRNNNFIWSFHVYVVYINKLI